MSVKASRILFSAKGHDVKRSKFGPFWKPPGMRAEEAAWQEQLRGLHETVHAFVQQRRGPERCPAEEQMDRKPDRKPFLGEWLIEEMDGDDEEDLDLLGPATLTFPAKGRGELRFFNIEGDLDARFSNRLGEPYVEFTWAGETEEEGDLSGRGWARLEGGKKKEKELIGRIFIHRGPDLLFRAVLATCPPAKKRRKKASS